MNEAVLDASVVIKWFHREGESHVEAARALRTQFEDGVLEVQAPTLLWLEILNVAARRWRSTQAKLEQLANSLTRLDFEMKDPDITAVARWTGQGLTAHDAAYVALAEQAGVHLVTDDEQILRVAPELAVGLANADSG